MSHWTTSGRSRLKAKQNRSFAHRSQQRAKVVAPEVGATGSSKFLRPSMMVERKQIHALTPRLLRSSPILRRGIVVKIRAKTRASPQHASFHFDPLTSQYPRGDDRIRDPSIEYHRHQMLSYCEFPDSPETPNVHDRFAHRNVAEGSHGCFMVDKHQGRRKHNLASTFNTERRAHLGWRPPFADKKRHSCFRNRYHKHKEYRQLKSWESRPLVFDADVESCDFPISPSIPQEESVPEFVKINDFFSSNENSDIHFTPSLFAKQPRGWQFSNTSRKRGPLECRTTVSSLQGENWSLSSLGIQTSAYGDTQLTPEMREPNLCKAESRSTTNSFESNDGIHLVGGSRFAPSTQLTISEERYHINMKSVEEECVNEQIFRTVPILNQLESGRALNISDEKSSEYVPAVENLASNEYEEEAIEDGMESWHFGAESAASLEESAQPTGLSMFQLRNREFPEQRSSEVQVQEENSWPLSFESTESLMEDVKSSSRFFNNCVEVNVGGEPISASTPKNEEAPNSFVNIREEEIIGYSNR